MPIVDQFGRPFPKRPDARSAALSAAQSMVRPAWVNAVAPGMTPERMARVLRESATGNNGQDLLTLAEDMEEKDLHYYSLLQTRKLAVTGSPLKVKEHNHRANTKARKSGQKVEPNTKAEMLRDAVQDNLVSKPAFRRMLQDLLDGLAKSYSVVQMIWDTTTAPWSVTYQHEDARLFCFDRDTQREIRLRSPDSLDGLPLPPGQFLVHFPHLRSGIPMRGGLARLAAVTWMFKNFTIKDWVAFAEVYGMPLRVATYDPAAMNETEISSLRMALADMGHDAAGMVPLGVELEIVDVNRGSNGGPFSPLAEYFDKQLSKGILGQTMTTDDGSSLAQSQTHEKVRQDIRQADAETLQDTVQTGLIEPWVLMNFGETARDIMPEFIIETEPPEDLTAFTTAALPWVKDAGLKVSARQIREKFSLLEPEGPDDELGAADPVELAGAQAEAKAKFAPKPAPGAKPKAAANFALRSAPLPETIQITEDLAASLADEWEELLAPHRRAIVEAAANASNYDEFMSALDKATEHMESDAFVRQLAIAGMKARGIGDGKAL